MHVCESDYEARLYTAAFLLAFYGFLRVSEFTVEGRHKQERMLRREDVTVTGNAPSRRVELFLSTSKTDQRGNGCTISIPEMISRICPVKAVLRYLEMRPRSGEAFLCSFGASPLTRHEFGTKIKKCMEYSGIPAAKFSSHSFRIGAATTAAMAGIPDAQIQHMGRWASIAHRRYIRLDMVL